MAVATKTPLNSWRGKAGAMVYRVRNGKQVVAALQSSVSNPRTDAQLAQRARFNLMTGINKVTPIEVLRGYRGGAAQKRAAFAKNLAESITANYVSGSEGMPGMWVGEINPANINFDLLSESYFLRRAGIQLLDSGTGVAQVVFAGDEMPNVSGIIMRVVDVYGPASRPVSVHYQDIAWDSSNVMEFQFNGYGRHRFYAQAVIPTSSLNSVNGKYPRNQSEVNIPIEADLTGGMAENYSIGHAIYLGSIDIVQSE